MRARVLDLDGSLLRQPTLLARVRTSPLPLNSFAPRIRLGCREAVFRAFQQLLTEQTGSSADAEPFLTYYGSGDFHHVSLALLRRLATPCNLLVLDKHPDWMRGLPFLHCGSWLAHAAALPHVGRVFHVGGELDFDNGYRWLAPWRWLRIGKITVIPARRRFSGRRWTRVPHRPLRRKPDLPADAAQVAEVVASFRAELRARPLYVSLDKDVLTADEATVNWDSGCLHSAEALEVVRAFTAAAGGQLVGMDVVGDWSPVRVRGLFRRTLHWAEHPISRPDPDDAATRNERLNLAILQAAAIWSASSRVARPLLAA
jgi:arginase family enzyme